MDAIIYHKLYKKYKFKYKTLNQTLDLLNQRGGRDRENAMDKERLYQKQDKLKDQEEKLKRQLKLNREISSILIKYGEGVKGNPELSFTSKIQNVFRLGDEDVEIELDIVPTNWIYLKRGLDEINQGDKFHQILKGLSYYNLNKYIARICDASKYQGISVLPFMYGKNTCLSAGESKIEIYSKILLCIMLNIKKRGDVYSKNCEFSSGLDIPIPKILKANDEDDKLDIVLREEISNKIHYYLVSLKQLAELNHLLESYYEVLDNPDKLKKLEKKWKPIVENCQEKTKSIDALRKTKSNPEEKIVYKEIENLIVDYVKAIVDFLKELKGLNKSKLHNYLHQLDKWSVSKNPSKTLPKKALITIDPNLLKIPQVFQSHQGLPPKYYSKHFGRVRKIPQDILHIWNSKSDSI